MTVPPVNSIEKCRPRVARKNTAARKVTSEITLKISACRMNGMSRRIRKNSILPFGDCFGEADQLLAATLGPGFQTCPIDTPLRRFLRPYQRLTSPRENMTAENIDVMIPRQWTIAKPRTGPEPN